MKSYSILLIILLILPILALSRNRSNEETDWSGTPQAAFLNSDIVKTYQCNSCHTIAERGGTVGPILNQVGNRRSQEWLKRWLADPQLVKPGTKMPSFDFSPEQLETVVGYLTNMKRNLKTDEILAKDLSSAEKGEMLFKDYDCQACHRVGAEGRFVGPDLTWIGMRKTETWEQVWLTDPPGFKPDTFMPNFHIPKKGVEALAAYLHTKEGQENEDSQRWEFRTNFFLGNSSKERGELVFKRFACWSCHGENGSGGIKNPNMAPDEMMPALKTAAANYTQKELFARLTKKSFPKVLDPNKNKPPFFCPDYANHIDESEFDDLYAYLQSFAPKRRKWRFK
ncbi:MAG: c-type cytochrome [bacterium]